MKCQDVLQFLGGRLPYHGGFHWPRARNHDLNLSKWVNLWVPLNGTIRWLEMKQTYIYIFIKFSKTISINPIISCSSVQNGHVVPHSWVFVSNLAVRLVTWQLIQCMPLWISVAKEITQVCDLNERKLHFGWSWLQGRESEVPSEDKPSGQLMIIFMHLGLLSEHSHIYSHKLRDVSCVTWTRENYTGFDVDWSWLQGRESEVPSEDKPSGQLMIFFMHLGLLSEHSHIYSHKLHDVSRVTWTREKYTGFDVDWSWLQGRESEVPSEDKPSGQLMIIFMHLGLLSEHSHIYSHKLHDVSCVTWTREKYTGFDVDWSWLQGRESEVPSEDKPSGRLMIIFMHLGLLSEHSHIYSHKLRDVSCVTWTRENYTGFDVDWSWLQGRESEVPSEDKPSGQLMIIFMHLGLLSEHSHIYSHKLRDVSCVTWTRENCTGFDVDWSWLQGRESEVPSEDKPSGLLMIIFMHLGLLSEHSHIYLIYI